MEGIQQDTVEAWFLAHVEGVTLPLRFERIAGGHSNLTFRVLDAYGRAFVLRRPPLAGVLESAHDVAREYRVLAALQTSAVPVPAVRGVCTDRGVNGAPFYVMDFVEGRVLHSAQDGQSVPFAQRRELGFALLDVLARIHAVDLAASGLSSLARHDAYIERQLKRWSRQYQAAKVRELPALTRAAELLEANIPAQHGCTIVHGDYRLGNCLVANGQIAAVLDWELCTLGDPLADLGYLLNSWLSADELGPGDAKLCASAAGGFPTREELVERYAQLTGRDVSAIDYYRAFHYWRSTAINEGVYARYMSGAMGEEASDLTLYEAWGKRHAELALELIEGLAKGA